MFFKLFTVIHELFSAHIYLLAAAGFFAVWVLLFPIIQKGKRSRMVIFSLSTLLLGYFVEQMHFVDWWQPNFVFDTPVTLEDALFGFSFGGVVYAFQTIFCRYLAKESIFSFSLFTKIVSASTSAVLLFGMFYVLGVHSFWSSITALCIPIIMVAIYMRPFLLPSFFVGITVTSIAACGYLFALELNPQFVTETYLLSQLSGVLLLGIPMEEFVWFFFASMGVAAAVSILES